ncbi:SUMF1/EgtB/PvdO family nonheme iron enzyme [Fibrobacter sp. UWB12]|uniref:formylglycine-generating enzyme family protein n=1 Tax=Fibrobacter sp. UWB12 TaxID=1896203 RepID=UPI0009130A16|nr:SUMF1/EgtB/PvdO family nonheme iron enzyme [Fibrobacter sp. UWB12]SHK66939.1 Sulfatase-modifying factor enzyme 1 [Fibrobacter sp. UWB12]
MAKNTNTPKNAPNKQNKKNGKRNLVILILMFLLLVCLFVVQCQLNKVKQQALEEQKLAELALRQKEILDSLRAEQAKADSLKAIEDARITDSLRRADSLRTADSLANLPKVNKDSLKHARDSIRAERKARRDSLDALAKNEKAKQDSLDKLREAENLRNSDKVPPTAEITPPAGRYYSPIKLKVKCDEIKCKTFVSIGDTLNPQDASKPIDYNKTGSVFFLAEDSVGNRTAWEEAKYDMASDNICGKNAYPVPVGGKTVCVDAYEYPNQPDATPKDMVSQEEAARICKNEGKHLCSIEEWQAACRGKDGFKYSYGNSYKQSKCNTNTKSAKRSGRKTQCRSWWGMNDMNGNLWEWTSSTSKQHPDKYLVAGGAWNTNNESSCSESKFSFYPQNQYPSVGFRCCK